MRARRCAILAALLAALLCAGVAAAETSGTGAELRLLSFDGGGHEYTVEIEDPSILACAGERDYGPGDHSLETGSTFEQVFTFTGLKPGTTAVAVWGRSPILENDDRLYTATVDAALNVTLTAERAISTFFLSRTGDIHYDSYSITREPDGYRASVNDGEPQAIDGAVVEALARAVEEYDLARWDGFRESREFVLDGESFWLELRLTDGSHISASGDNAFPEGYFPAISAIQDILDGAGLG